MAEVDPPPGGLEDLGARLDDAALMAAGPFFAHSTEDPSRQDWQPLREHLETVAALAAASAAKFGAGEWGRVCGLLHDLGKYSKAFQARLSGAGRTDHATTGAREADRTYGLLSRAVQFVVAGHHAGLADGRLPRTRQQRRTPLAERLAHGADGRRVPAGSRRRRDTDGAAAWDHRQALCTADARGHAWKLYELIGLAEGCSTSRR